MCKSFAPCSRQITTPILHYSTQFLQAICPSCRPGNSEIFVVLSYWFVPGRSAKHCNEHDCFHVRPLTCRKPHVHTFWNFLYMLAVAVAWSSFDDDDAVLYVLLIVWMTSRLPIISQAKMMPTAYTKSESPGGSTRGKALYLWLSCSCVNCSAVCILTYHYVSFMWSFCLKNSNFSRNMPLCNFAILNGYYAFCVAIIIEFLSYAVSLHFLHNVLNHFYFISFSIASLIDLLSFWYKLLNKCMLMQLQINCKKHALQESYKREVQMCPLIHCCGVMSVSSCEFVSCCL